LLCFSRRRCVPPSTRIESLLNLSRYLSQVSRSSGLGLSRTDLNSPGCTYTPGHRAKVFSGGRWARSENRMLPIQVDLRRKVFLVLTFVFDHNFFALFLTALRSGPGARGSEACAPGTPMRPPLSPPLATLPPASPPQPTEPIPPPIPPPEVAQLAPVLQAAADIRLGLRFAEGFELVVGKRVLYFVRLT
jgi:hypothetical protein